MLIPNKQPIIVLQGQSGEVICESEAPTREYKLKWEKKQVDKSYAAVPKSQVNITKDANNARAVLKVTNAQFADAGTYKCTVQYPPNKSTDKETKIIVLGRLALLYSIARLLLIAFYLQHSIRSIVCIYITTVEPIYGHQETIAPILQPYNIRVAHKPITTLRRLSSATFTNNEAAAAIGEKSS